MADEKPISILVIEDDLRVLEFLASELKARGYQIQAASSGGEALELARAGKFNIVISDLKMPLMDGIAVLENIKAMDPEIEVIIASGQGSIGEAVDAMKKGAFDFVEKPIEMQQLFLSIQRALEKSELKTLIALYESSKAVFSEAKLEELLEKVMDLLRGLLRADESSLMLVDARGHLFVASASSLGGDILCSASLALGERVAGFAAERRREYLLVGSLENYPEFRGLEGRSHIRSSIVIPVYHKEELLGVLNLNRTTQIDNFTPDDVRKASIFASQIAQAIQNAKLYSDLDDKIRELKGAYAKLQDAQNRLIEKERLASVGSLVAGVAHEINNPLMAVTGYVDLLLSAPDLSSDKRRKLAIVHKEAVRCQTLVKELLNFSKQRVGKREWVDLRALVEEVLELCVLDTVKCGICVRVFCRTNEARVQGDGRQLKQVFINLLKNSHQALRRCNRQKNIEISLEKDGDKIRAIFADNGPGIPEDLMPRIFEPFFTTKGADGTGLGLSISQKIIEEHGGRITVQSAPDQGAAFTLLLPIENPPYSFTANGR